MDIEEIDLSWLEEAGIISNRDKQLKYVDYLLDGSKLGKKLYSKLRKLDFNKLISKFIFNPKKPNDIFTITESLPPDDNDFIAIEGFILIREKCNYKIDHYLIIQWLFETLFHPHSKHYHINNLASDWGSNPKLSKRVDIYQRSIRFKVPGAECDVTECCYPWNEMSNLLDGRRRLTLVLRRSDLSSLITIVNHVYPFTKYITDYIKEMIGNNWILCASNNKSMVIEPDSTYSDLLKALEPEFRNVYKDHRFIYE